MALIGSDAKKPYTAGTGSGGVLNSNVASVPYDAFINLGVDVIYSDATELADAVAAAQVRSMLWVQTCYLAPGNKKTLSYSPTAWCLVYQTNNDASKGPFVFFIRELSLLTGDQHAFCRLQMLRLSSVQHTRVRAATARTCSSRKRAV